MNITLEEIVAEYERLIKRESPHGLTTEEIRKLTNWPLHQVNRFINNSLDAGLMECRHETRQDRAGNWRKRPVYVWLKRKRGANGKRRSG